MLHSKYSKCADVYVNGSKSMRKLELQVNDEKSPGVLKPNSSADFAPLSSCCIDQ